MIQPELAFKMMAVEFLSRIPIKIRAQVNKTLKKLITNFGAWEFDMFLPSLGFTQ